MKNPNHRELEIKIDAEKVDVLAFQEFCTTGGCGKVLDRYLHVVGPDTYYVQGKNVLRHRQSGGPGELTVKKRTSRSSTKDRLEIDLRFDPRTSIDDVKAFLEATGWIPQFTVVKDAHVYWYGTEPGVEVVIYDVRCYDNRTGKVSQSRRFAEIEIHKADSNHPEALAQLKAWENLFRAKFPSLGATMGESLYEIYSGQRVSLVK